MWLNKDGFLHRQLVSQVAKQGELRPNGIPISSLVPLSPRNDQSLDFIFEEGQAFSGITQVGDAEVCLTTTASPHIRPTIPTPTFLKAVENVLGPQATIPRSLYQLDLLPSQLLMWWRKAGNSPKDEYDFLKMTNAQEVDDFSKAISLEATKAVKIITQFNQPPQIWGSWGFGTRNERSKSGLSRGAPTNGFGHCHFTNFSADQQIILSADVATGDAINHYRPWGMLVHQEFGLDIADVIEQIADEHSPHARVEPFSELLGNPNWHWVRSGYRVTFDEALPFDATMGLTINIANYFSEVHQEALELFGKYYQSSNSPRVRQNMREMFESYGFTHIGAENLTEFLTNIKPTRGLLEQWLKETPSPYLADMLSRYKRASQYLESDEKKSRTPARVLMKDTYRNPKDLREPIITLPQHSSGWFLITDYTLGDKQIMVDQLELFANLATTEAAPQSLLGAILRRSMP